MTANTQFLAFAYPGELSTRTGGYIYDARIIQELEGAGQAIRKLALGDGFPFPTSDVLAEALQLLTDLPPRLPLIVDGLAFGTFGEAARMIAAQRPLIALVHHPLCLETGLSEADQAALRASEMAALACVAGVVVTSPATADTLTGAFGVPDAKICVAVPGHDRKPRAAPKQGPVRLLAVGTVSARKDFPALVRALAPLCHLDWELVIAGSLTREREAAEALQTLIATLGMQRRVSLLGEVDEVRLAAEYARAHLFAASSRYEGYGMAMMDAIGCGLPVVAVKGGAVEKVLPKDASILAGPDDQAALTSALALMIENADERQRMSDIAWSYELPSWQGSARLIETFVKELTTR